MENPSSVECFDRAGKLWLTIEMEAFEGATHLHLSGERGAVTVQVGGLEGIRPDSEPQHTDDDGGTTSTNGEEGGVKMVGLSDDDGVPRILVCPQKGQRVRVVDRA